MQTPATPSSLLFGRPPNIEPIGFSRPPPETPSLFFTLSAELRNRIYRYALYRAPLNLPIAYEPLPALLATCRQIRSEATALYFFLNVFTLELRMSEAEHCLNLLIHWVRIRTAQNQLSLILGLKIYILLDGSAPKCDPRYGDVLDGEWPMSKEGKEMIFGSKLRNLLLPVKWCDGRDLVSVVDIVVHGTSTRRMEAIPPEDMNNRDVAFDRWWRTRLA
ncbi:unnamed protein product [Zymoseptoria tritici ST99CH_3D1]|uniref:Uncharacterized protein n=1 Tax=Zymoseptoria tritici (strain ST99CH_3D7) TaxID=1276538 RepID=A0A1X7S1R7_ZYMT9|nr:unnamed protein product [Zymoseptoria tritici ST99CH_3D7]SMR60058.1 unnamed protein product [Zymoseptoria tritici ST99CH_3D1]